MNMPEIPVQAGEKAAQLRIGAVPVLADMGPIILLSSVDFWL